jgi:hypothetical protein
MSRRAECPDCGQPMDVPAYPGDGVYSEHHCALELLRDHQRQLRIAEGFDPDEAWGGSDPIRPWSA